MKWKGYNNSFNSRIDKKDVISIFSEPYECSGGNMKIEVDFSKDAPKNDLENKTDFEISNLVAKSDLASFYKLFLFI